MTGRNKTIKLKRPPLPATLLVLAGVIILCGLGSWQIRRLHWKQDILARIEAGQKVDPEKMILSFGDLVPGNAFRRGRVQGIFRHELEIALGPRTYKGRPGYHIYTPLTLSRGGAVLVNRGWVPLALKEAGSRPESLPGGNVSIDGTLLNPPRPNFFTPENRPEQGAWYRLSLAEIAKRQELDSLAPVYIQAEGTPAPGGYPVPDGRVLRPANNHLHYALFWFAMAGSLVVIYILRFLKPRPQA